MQDRRGQSMMADDDDRLEVMGLAREVAALDRCEGSMAAVYASGHPGRGGDCVADLCCRAMTGRRGSSDNPGGPDGSTRGPPPCPARSTPARRSTRFGKAWMHEHVNDHYVQEAQRRGYRSRAAFKLLELADRDALLRPASPSSTWARPRAAGRRCCASGSGATGRIVAVDLLPMDGLTGVTFVQADFRDDAGLAAVESALAGAEVDLVVSDMAPNLSGIDPVDQARSIHLGELALEFAISHLREGGDFLVKVFQGAGLVPFQKALSARFTKVYVRKPKSSRDRSRETFLVGKGFHA